MHKVKWRCIYFWITLMYQYAVMILTMLNIHVFQLSFYVIHKIFRRGTKFPHLFEVKFGRVPLSGLEYWIIMNCHVHRLFSYFQLFPRPCLAVEIQRLKLVCFLQWTKRDVFIHVFSFTETEKNSVLYMKIIFFKWWTTCDIFQIKFHIWNNPTVS